MKKEPLKDKAFELDPNVDEDEGSAFWFKDVQSAVQGLIEEIEKMKETYTKELERVKRGDDKQAWKIYTAKKHTAFRILLKIKRWFSDVVREDEMQHLYA